MTKFVDLTQLADTLMIKEPTKLAAGEGKLVEPLGLSFRWKVTGQETDYAFAVYEMTMASGTGIPMHFHPFAEFFYVLEGQVEVVTTSASGEKVVVDLSAAECANVPSNTPHSLRNTSGSPARFLSVASFAHEEAFNRIDRAMQAEGGASLSEEEQAALFIRVAGEDQVHFIKPD